MKRMAIATPRGAVLQALTDKSARPVDCFIRHFPGAGLPPHASSAALDLPTHIHAAPRTYRLDRVRSAGEGQLTLLRWLRYTIGVSRQRLVSPPKHGGQDVTVAATDKTRRSGMAGLSAENVGPGPCPLGSNLAYDNVRCRAQGELLGEDPSVILSARGRLPIRWFGLQQGRGETSHFPPCERLMLLFPRIRIGQYPARRARPTPTQWRPV